MEKSNYTKVLWVGYDSDTKAVDCTEAGLHNLQLEFCNCWNDAKSKLESNYDRWQAIIFDIDNYEQGTLVDALIELREIYAKNNKNWLIHWYILTNGECPQIPNPIKKDLDKWDADWTKEHIGQPFYLKSTQKECLFENINSNAKKSQRILTREKYYNVYKQLKALNKEVCDDVFTILEEMHYPNSHPDFTPRHFYNPMRTALEYVFRTTQEVGIIPDEFFSKGKVNLNQCFMFLIGNNADHIGYRYGEFGERIAPQYIQDMMSLIINLGNSSSHSIENHETELSDEEMLNYDNYIEKNGGNSKLLIFSIALQFCEIVQWMEKYIEEHPQKDENSLKWNKFTGVVERDANNYYHMGNYSLNPNKITEDLEGRTIRITKRNINKYYNKNGNRYQYYADDFYVIEQPESNSK